MTINRMALILMTLGVLPDPYASGYVTSAPLPTPAPPKPPPPSRDEILGILEPRPLATVEERIRAIRVALPTLPMEPAAPTVRDRRSFGTPIGREPKISKLERRFARNRKRYRGRVAPRGSR